MIEWHLKHEKYGCAPWAVQREALNRSEGKDRYAHFLEQGLGKTPLVLNEFIHYCKLGIVDTLFIVCPESFKLSWVEALKDWGLTALPIKVWPESFPLGASAAAYVINWEAIRTESALKFIGKLKRKVFLVLDETSYIGNPAAQVTKRAMQISRGARMVRLLNGTPQTSSVVNYYGQLKCLNELEGLLITAFRARFAQTTWREIKILGGHGETRQVPVITGTKNGEELAKILARCSFRATKAEWRKDLPPRIISTVRVAMTPAQKRHYAEMRKEFLTIIKGEKVKADLVLTQLAKLRQISSGIIISDGKETIIEEITSNPKFLAFLALYNGQKNKIIVVHNYKLTGKMLGEFLTSEKIKWAYIKGQMENSEVERQKDLFNNNPEYRVMLCQQAAACMGHTLLGGTGDDRCNGMIFVENSFSLRDRLQMLDRNHRGEQDQTCVVYDLVASATEQKIIRALNENKALADMVDELVAALDKGD